MSNEPDLSKVKASDIVDRVTEDNPANETDKSSGGASGTTDPKSNPKDKPVNDTITGD